MQKIFVYEFDLPGMITIGEKDGQINYLLFSDAEYFASNYTKEFEVEETVGIQEAKKQLEEYFNGDRKMFNLPLLPEGTEFQKKVWEALQTIPYGETKSYGQIAMQVDNPKASRAVGMANNRNPISIIIPCHRVIGSTGKLVGYGGGLHIKIKLLTLEKENCQK